ncbi:hypothetical protein HDU97_002879 [Phlyctochytrium planicorne]|nr:hypothetical protein HDU97_002879 [Phlyctochytrium planicorne]
MASSTTWTPDSLSNVPRSWSDETTEKLYSSLKSYLSSSSTSSLQETISTIDSLCTQSSDSEPKYLFEFWDLLHHFAMEIPFDHPVAERLLAFVGALAAFDSVRLKEFIDPDFGTTMRLWSDLPYFEMQLREAITGSNHSPSTWQNLWHYMARLTSNPAINLDLTHHAIKPIDSLFRWSDKDRDQVLASLTPADFDILDLWSGLCADQWAGNPGMLVSVDKNVERRRKNGIEKWNRWRDGLEEVVDSPGVGEEVKIVAGRVLERMVKAHAKIVF